MGHTEGSVDLLSLGTCERRTRSTWNVAAWLGNRKDKLGISGVPSVHPNSEERNKKTFKEEKSNSLRSRKRIEIRNLV